MKYIIQILSITFCFNTVLFSQNSNTNNTGYKQKFVPPSPNASALGKYGDIPVSTYTGIPNISIPLHELKASLLKLPISLSYHSSGIKVDEVASAFGLGWSLNAGGVISRVIQDKPDEASEGYGNTNFDRNNCTDVRFAADGLKDAQPDQFYFNVAGLSGRFYLERVNGITTARLTSHQDIQLTMPNNNYFQLITSDGTKYIFKQIENTYKESIDASQAVGTGGTTAWYLTEIVHITGDAIKLSYASVPMSYLQSVNTTKALYKLLGCGSMLTSNTVTNLFTDGVLLQKIKSRFEEVNFIYDHTRLDLQGGNKALSRIEIYGKEDSTSALALLKKYNLEYSYFESNSALPPYATNQDAKRLKLKSITEIGIQNGIEQSNPPYRLEYLENDLYCLPPRFSYKQDHWGGANNNTMPTLLPYIPGIFDSRYGADRSTDPERTKAGMIKAIHYPTGGKTEFEFEANQVYSKPGPLYFYDEVAMDSRNVFLSAAVDNSMVTRRSTIFDLEFAQFIQISTTQGNTYGNQEVAYMKILKIQDNQEVEIAAGTISNNNWTTSAYYQPGRYQLEISNLVPSIDASLSVTFDKIVRRRDAMESAVVGGVRIKRIKDFDDANSLTPVIKKYEYLDDSLRSSGRLVSIPQYTHEAANYSPSLGMGIGIICDQTILHAESQAPLGMTQGSHIAYTKVAVYSGENGAGGKSEMYYSWAEDILNYNYPFVQHESYDWKRGYLERQIDYSKQSDGTYKAVKRTDNTYKFDRFRETGLQGANTYVKKGYAVAYHPSNPELILDCNRVFEQVKINEYRMIATWVSLMSSRINQDGVITETTYEYDETNGNHTQPKVVTVTNSDGKILKTETTYSKDFTNSSNTPAVQELINRNILVPLEVRVYINGALQGGIKNTYQLVSVNAQSIPLPYQWLNILSDNSDLVRGTAEAYTGDGLLNQVKQYGFNTAEVYIWNKGLLLEKRFGQLKHQFGYNPVTRQLTTIVDENGLKTKFYYDGFQRLKKTENRMLDDGTDVQATTEYLYQYKDANNPFSFVRTTATFKGVNTSQVTEAYIDGLGRAIGIMKQNYTPNNLHLKSAVTYDAFGRKEKMYHPFESGVLGYQNAVNGMPADKIEYEASPLNRPIKNIKADNAATLTSYSANIANEVRIFTGSGSDVVSSSTFYAANSLFKTVLTDENGKQTVIFKDKLNRLILTRKFLNGQNVDTYNVYDNAGQLIAILPPGAESNGVVNNNITFQYKYDIKNRLVEKKVPGSEAQKFYYDARDLVVLTQDGNMRAANNQKHLGTEYDALGRVLKTGFVMASPTAGQDYTATISITTSDRLTETEYYPNKSWVKHQGARVLKPTGTYTPTDFVWSYVERRDALNYTGNPVWTAKQHLMSANVSNQPIQDWDVAGVDWSVTGVNGAQQPLVTIRYLNGGGVSDVRTWQEFAYDNGMRMTDQKYLYALHGAGLSSPTFTLSNQVYNYKDQLIEKNIGYRGVNNALQSIDYQYNIRGWLTGINTVNVYNGGMQLLTPSSKGVGGISGLAVTPFIGEALAQGMTSDQQLQGKTLLMPPVVDNNADLFSQVLTYDNPDGRTQANPQSNGNISSTTWQIAGRSKQAYGFSYDDLNRLTDAKYFDVTDSYSNGWNSNFSGDYKFNEQLTYDLRGNITTLQRNGLNSNGWTGNNFVAGTYGVIDNLTYAYNAKNQLKSIVESSLFDRGFKTNPSATGDQYRYDANGNLTKDKNKYIDTIEYNCLNLPIKVVINNPNDVAKSGSIEFVYDATGAKLRKTVKYSNGSVKETWDYVNGVEYKNQILQRVAHSEGAVVRNDAGSYEHEYALRDHLGSTRVLFTDSNNDGIVTEADIKHINHTYPFGMAMEGNWNNAGTANNNQYLYNGKQWNDDLGMGLYDYNTRWYDPSIARWGSVDPLAEKMSRYSTYNYTFNNPVRFIDPNGMEPEDPIATRLNKLAVSLNAEFKKIYATVTPSQEAGASFVNNKPLPMKNSADGNVIVKAPTLKEGETHTADYHGHTNDTEKGGFTEGSPPSMQDVFNVSNTSENFTSFIETKNTRYALVVTNTADYKAFAKGSHEVRKTNMVAFKKAIGEKLKPAAEDYKKTHNGSLEGFDKVAAPIIEKATAAFLKTNKTGLILYKAIDINRTNFLKAGGW